MPTKWVTIDFFDTDENGKIIRSGGAGMKFHLTMIMVLLLLAACLQTEEPAPAPTTAIVTLVEEANVAEVLVEEPTVPATNTIVPEPEPEQLTAETEPPAVATLTVEAPPEETAVPAIEPIEVTYITPSQQEGPYYTVEKPEDRDNDLVDFAGATGAPNGQVLHLSGIVYDANGLPIEGITVEIWQTDANGAYLHPQDPATASRDPNFQFYGESVTGSDGVYSFRTILPGLYEPRPRHIHVKVKLDDQELLTTQFYFSGEIELQGDAAAMLITTAPAENDAGNPILIGERDIILSLPVVNQ
jgi:protocatechuate 3,4-dioxygenase beta subunit